MLTLAEDGQVEISKGDDTFIRINLFYTDRATGKKFPYELQEGDIVTFTVDRLFQKKAINPGETFVDIQIKSSDTSDIYVSANYKRLFSYDIKIDFSNGLHWSAVYPRKFIVRGVVDSE